jgi:hypothetical protein
MSKDVVFYSHGRRVKRFIGLLIAMAIAGFFCLFACHHSEYDFLSLTRNQYGNYSRLGGRDLGLIAGKLICL